MGGVCISSFQVSMAGLYTIHARVRVCVMEGEKVGGRGLGGGSYGGIFYVSFMLCAGLIRYASPHDGQTVLHRAALGCQTDNVVLLLRTDEKLANIQDNYGNTALQIACSKAHKQTVRALLVMGLDTYVHVY